MLPPRRLLAVTAHPDDESFGLGSVISALVARGVRVSLLCFTQGERSTLGADRANLGMLRRRELTAAADVLGIEDIALLAYPDGQLVDVAGDELIDHITQRAVKIDTLLVFDEGGVTGHPDHCRATDVALAAAEILDLAVLAWAIPQSDARQLNEEFGTTFVGREESELDLVIEVDRTRQLEAITCHDSQSAENPVLWRRLNLTGSHEWLRSLRPTHRRLPPADIDRWSIEPADT